MPISTWIKNLIHWLKSKFITIEHDHTDSEHSGENVPHAFPLPSENEFNQPEEGAVTTTNANTNKTSLGSSVDLSRTFFLHSNPTATKTIFLDFDGHTTTRTNWNNKISATLTTPAFSSDSNPNVLSNAELERIQYIWQRVAEDFMPFGIDVTTQDPGEEGLNNTGGTDTKWGVRVAIGGSYKDWYGSSAGGVAYVNVFGLAAYGPAFVFSNNLGKGNEKYTAEAASHEAGHSLGLWHDGTDSASYYKGQGNWAPIMGSGYYKALTQWDQGEFNNARNKGDDLSIISNSRNGAGFRTDDFGDNAATATVLTGTTLNQFGIIATRTDSDWFKFTTGAGTVSLSITTALQAWVNDGAGNYTSVILPSRSPNLDIAATLYDASGTLISTNNPTKSLTASFKQTLTAGTYFLKVDGVGFGDPLTTGYSDYGSLGGYLVTGTLA